MEALDRRRDVLGNWSGERDHWKVAGMSKVTEWFPGDVKPVRVGVYERDYGGTESLGIVHAHWNGKQWAVFGVSASNAEQFKGLRSSYQLLPWRGLASDPSKEPK